MSPIENTNIYKFTDYKVPILYTETDYRTSTGRAHRACSSKERNFLGSNLKNLCDVLADGSDYPPDNRYVSEKESHYFWKVNSSRFKREDLAPALVGVGYINQHMEKINSQAPIIGINPYLQKEHKPFQKLFSDPTIPEKPVFQPQYKWKTISVTDTDGINRTLDPLASTTTLDFIPHKDYTQAKTNLIVRDDFVFNSDKKKLMPKSFLVKTFPIYNKYDANILRDARKFPTSTRDRDHMVPRRWNFVPRGLTTEMRSNY